VLHVYAFTDGAGTPLPDIAGLGDAELAECAVDRVAAVFSRVDEPPPASEAALWRHEEVLEALMGSRAVLPVRFGASLRDEAALENELRARLEGLRESLTRVAGRVEVAVRVAGTAAPAKTPSASASGREFILGRLAEVRRAAEAAASIHAPLSRLAVAAECRQQPDPATIAAAAYLVDRDAVEAFGAEVERVAARHPELRVVSTGPWPPWSFAG
jgi:Gas vesicle synthesis protein GvpL/GvpF